MTNEREDKVRKVLEQAFKSNDTEFDMEPISLISKLKDVANQKNAYYK